MTHTPPEGITYEQWRQILEILGSGKFVRLEVHPLDDEDAKVLSLGMEDRTRTFWGMTVTWLDLTSDEGRVTSAVRRTRTTAFPIHAPRNPALNWCAPTAEEAGISDGR